MSGKGRGRGRAQFTFNIEAIGFSRGESLPDTRCQPLPLFPPTEFKPVPLNTGEDANYILALKQELRGTCKKLPYYIEAAIENKDVERYTQKYTEKDGNKNWTPDWRRLPRELKPRTKVLKKAKTVADAPSVSKMKSPVVVADKSNEDVIQKLEVLEKKDTENKSDEETEEKEKEEEENAEDEEYIEEEVEEDNDYIASYFEDGDDYAVSDDNMDEATY
ncbi:DNA-directed RNA polymerase III subunit RPC7 [Amblyraja radiata]|uniref:DNA-directed RNA polymerase III subunit RPC7 n=1 Tax=Amblyraja radiata TaxID=386614 RepID=UPI001401C806|nr:DNA-directed RNA polymerase III subunit RPC7 [Amblyraja radiata]